MQARAPGVVQPTRPIGGTVTETFHPGRVVEQARRVGVDDKTGRPLEERERPTTEERRAGEPEGPHKPPPKPPKK